MGIIKLKKSVNMPLLLMLCLGSGIIVAVNFPGTMKKVNFIGEMYLKLMELCVVPLIFLSILSSAVSFMKTRIKIELVLYFKYWFSGASVLAVIGLGIAYIWYVPVNINKSIEEYQGIATMNLSEVLENAVPNNIIGAFLSENILEVIVVAVLISFAVRNLSDEKKIKVVNCVDIMYTLQKEIVALLIKGLPIGIFFLASKIIGSGGGIKLKGTANMIVAIYIGYFMAFGVVYPIIVRKKLQESYREFIKRYCKALIMAFVSCSSSSAFPLVIDAVNQNSKKADETLAGISLILKHANCLQTPIYCVFVAKMYNIQLSFALLMLACVFGIFSSIGTAGIPGGGIVSIAAVFKMLNLPLEYVTIIAGIYPVVDILGTAMNVLDDCIGLTMVQKNS